jgi:transitional endoplasmic reticulum ATPase
LLSMSRRCWFVDDAVFNYLAGLSEDYISSNDYSVVEQTAFPVESFPVSEKERGLLLDSLSNQAPCHLFFYGRPGTGKTELAKALAAESGRQAFLVKYRDDGGERDRRGAIMATLKMAPPDSVVIIDEADRLLNTATLFQPKLVDKGWINNFMDECRYKVIWIANETGSIESSVLRRFSYSLEFKKFTSAQRTSAWNMQLEHHPLRGVIDPVMVSLLACDYEVDAGGIASALKATENVFTGRKPESSCVRKTLCQFLEHHEKLSGVQRSKKKLNRLNPHYDAAALNTDFSSAELISALKARQKNIENGHRPFSANILFWGLPGTGKTEFAKYLAQALGKELLVKRMSDLQSKFVGDTEKRIAEAFDEAEREGSVLFLDEADSLILDRKTASRSWEASQTNEVLTQMENFTGICICCTNLLDHLDESALRRFTWKIKFLPLTDEGKETLFRKYFQPQGRLASGVKAALREILDLTPGDFKIVRQRIEHRSDSPGTKELLTALKQEVLYKRSRTGRPMGFSA